MSETETNASSKGHPASSYDDWDDKPSHSSATVASQSRGDATSEATR